MSTSLAVYTVGHSTRTLEEFLALLKHHGVEEIVDVRRYPASRRYPHFNSDALAAALAAAGIAYRPEPSMGGRRSARRDSPHTAWRSASFRAYADHMETPVFQDALARLIECAASRRQAVMCAEAVPWRCHRQLISDALTALGVNVHHIISDSPAALHTLNDHAVVTDRGVAYPGPAAPEEAQTTLPL